MSTERMLVNLCSTFRVLWFCYFRFSRSKRLTSDYMVYIFFFLKHLFLHVIDDFTDYQTEI